MTGSNKELSVLAALLALVCFLMISDMQCSVQISDKPESGELARMRALLGRLEAEEPERQDGEVNASFAMRLHEFELMRGRVRARIEQLENEHDGDN